MVPNPQLCCMFSVSLYSSFTTSLDPGHIRSKGSGRGNFIDSFAEPEGARAPRGVGSRTRDIREHEDSARHSEAKNHRADLAMLAEAEKVIEVPVWHFNPSVQAVSVSSVRRLCSWMTHDQEYWASCRSLGQGQQGPCTHHQQPYELVLRDRIGGPDLADTASCDASRTRT
ncbi:hypothetical protein EDD15DRAFT_384478 [Pisolithus albus]|nr:hypothetical protein EDD15DRAFT_384478 [Pisolithus albus]